MMTTTTKIDGGGNFVFIKGFREAALRMPSHLLLATREASLEEEFIWEFFGGLVDGF